MLVSFRGDRKRKCNTGHFLQYLLPHSLVGQVQVGSSAGAAPLRKDIEGAQSSVQVGQKSTVEGKAKNRTDWISKRTGFREEIRA
jgi:hypothetical protein